MPGCGRNGVRRRCRDLDGGGRTLATLVVGGKETLDLPRRFEPLHDPLSSPGRLMGIFGSILEALVLLEHRHDLPLGRSIALQLVGIAELDRRPERAEHGLRATATGTVAGGRESRPAAGGGSRRPGPCHRARERSVRRHRLRDPRATPPRSSTTARSGSRRPCWPRPWLPRPSWPSASR